MKTLLATLLFSAFLGSFVFAENKPYQIAIRSENHDVISEAIVTDAFWQMFASKVPFEVAKASYESVYPDGTRETKQVLTAKEGSSASFKMDSTELTILVEQVGFSGAHYSFQVATKEWNDEIGLPNPDGAIIDLDIDEENQYSLVSIKLSGLDDEAIESYQHFIVILASNLKSVVETGEPLVNPEGEL